MPDEQERSDLKICGIHVKKACLGNTCGALWLTFAFTQMVLGFSTIGTCDANEELPTYTGVHGLLNMIYGIGFMLFVGHGYEVFVFRLVFYFAWIAEGALCITEFALYSNTVGYLKGCRTQCKTCSQHLVTGSIVIESFIFFLYILITFSIIGVEIKTKCKHCKVGDGNGERGHDTVPQPGIRTGPPSVSRGLDIARHRTSEDPMRCPDRVYIHNMNIVGASLTPVEF